MNAAKPHFLLFSESNREQARGQWRFVLQAVDGSDQFEAYDEEPNVGGERLELLAVVRGLEALPEPARVTLVTPSKYVNRGIAQGLPEWRHNGWQWEHFGEMVPVKNRDLWQRVDRRSISIRSNVAPGVLICPTAHRPRQSSRPPQSPRHSPPPRSRRRAVGTRGRASASRSGALALGPAVATFVFNWQAFSRTVGRTVLARVGAVRHRVWCRFPGWSNGSVVCRFRSPPATSGR